MGRSPAYSRNSEEESRNNRRRGQREKRTEDNNILIYSAVTYSAPTMWCSWRLRNSSNKIANGPYPPGAEVLAGGDRVV